jgi:hypothetical protein
VTNRSMISQCIEALDSLDSGERADARERLLEFGRDAIDPLIEALRSDTARRCWNAAEVLALIDDPRWIEPMQDVLTSPHPVLGQMAARALAQHGYLCVPALVAALPNSRMLAQVEIVLVLEHIGDLRAVAPLMELLRRTTSNLLRYTIIQALGTLGDRQAVELIRSFEQDDDLYLQKRVRIALQRLAGQGSEESHTGDV